MTRVDRSGTTGDWQALVLGGTVAADIANSGDVPVSEPFSVTFFADTNANGRFDAGTDTVLGTATAGALDVGASVRVQAPAAGPIAFRDDLIYAFADSGGAIAELDETNNLSHTGRLCAYRPAVGAFSPALEWEWTGSRIQSGSRQVMMTPAVMDLDGNGIPDVVFSTFASGNYEENGYLRAVRGDDGSEMFTVTDPTHQVVGAASLALGDIDGDGRPEIVAVHESSNSLIAFEHDGTFKWRGEALPFDVRWGGPALADLDADGRPEIVAGNAVLNADGTLRWAGDRSGGRGVTLSLVADMDLDGRPEIVGGNTVYRADGTVMWANRGVGDGFPAVGNFDADPYPEVALVDGGQVYLLDQDGSRMWGPVALPGGTSRGHGGPPTIADVDGDGRPEIGVAGGRAYMVLETNGRIRWSKTTQDLSSTVTGSSVFDFEGDGSAEVIYGDELRLRIYRGRDGVVLWDVPRPDGTTYDLPLVVDVDADGNAEIVVPVNNYAFPGTTGLRVYGDTHDTWVPTRKLWNQHTYHITNVNDDGTIPPLETPSWQAHNTYRLNLPPAGAPFAAPDVSAARITLGQVAGLPSLTARIGNGGALIAGAGLPVAFYAGDPKAGGRLIGVAPLPGNLAPGEWADVALIWRNAAAGATDVYAVADDDGRGRGTANECDETNNVHHHSVTLVPTATPVPTDTPTVTPTPMPTHTARPTATATVIPSATTTASATPRPTALPGPCYLPLLLKESYEPQRRHADVALILDASASMAGAKLAAARSAAGAFVSAMQLPDDQVAVVAFNHDAWLAAPLGADAAGVAAALDRLAPVPGTRIDRGLELAIAEVLGPGQRPGNRPVLVLLSDGRQYELPERARQVAEAARRAGVTVYAIGLGADVDGPFLAALAGEAGRYYAAPGGDQLLAIYLEIASLIPCDPAQFWGRRCRS